MVKIMDLGINLGAFNVLDPALNTTTCWAETTCGVDSCDPSGRPTQGLTNDAISQLRHQLHTQLRNQSI